MTEAPAQNQAPPEFEIRLDPPDLGPVIDGNTGIAGITTYDSGVPGPHVALTALMHGNEYSGAIALAEVLAAGVRPVGGGFPSAFSTSPRSSASTRAGRPCHVSSTRI